MKIRVGTLVLFTWLASLAFTGLLVAMLVDEDGPAALPSPGDGSASTLESATREASTGSWAALLLWTAVACSGALTIGGLLLMRQRGRSARDRRLLVRQQREYSTARPPRMNT